MGKLESRFQAEVIKDIYDRFGRDDCLVLKNDSGYLQGIPDLTVYYKDKWAMLECKREEHEHHQPNQDYYVDKTNRMSYSRFIFPENKDEVLNELEQTFKLRRKACISKCK